ncbi:hypothetical protein [Adlercreutzia rubneri]|uniref:hypothetical protein n=1 Tax=Adlercreutzia rubneri TaxID=2916441 RepID=UPI003527B7FA
MEEAVARELSEETGGQRYAPAVQRVAELALQQHRAIGQKGHDAHGVGVGHTGAP